MTETGLSSSTHYKSVFDVNQRLADFEERYDILKYQVLGWSVWPLFRFLVGMELNNVPMVINPVPWYFRLQEGLISLPVLLKHLEPSRFVFKTYSSGLADKTGNYYKDVWFDDLLDVLGGGFKISKLNNINFRKRNTLAYKKINLRSELLELSAYALSRFAFPPKEVYSISKEITALIFREFNLPGFSESPLSRKIFHFFKLKDMYQKILDKTKPEYVLTADPNEYSLLAAAKEVGVKTIEIQHGFLEGDAHPAYSWSSYASSYRCTMPLPDYLFLYGDYWKNSLDLRGFWGRSALAVGNPRLDKYRNQRNKLPQDKCSLLVTTQGIDVQNLIQFLAEFLELGKNEDFHMTIKLHPAFETDKSVYERHLGSGKVSVILGSEDPPTLELLSKSNLHASISSTCHYEAIGLGIPTVIIQLANSEKLKSLHTKGHAHLAKSPEDLLRLVRNYSDLALSTDVSSYYYKPNSLQNMCDALKNIERV